MTISLRLKPDFELVHEPITKVEAAIFAEEERVALKLKERLHHSSGGTFLVTGFRGVGKTTAVHQALRQLRPTTDDEVIGVSVPVARPLATSALLFEVIRRLVERLTEIGTLDDLTPVVRDRLLTAYARTSYSYRETRTTNEERATTLAAGGKMSAGKGALVLPLPKLSRSRSKSEGMATELSFLAYSDGDVEHDFLHIVELLNRADAVKRGRLARLLSRVKIGSGTEALKARLVIVFDEIDKLTEAEGGLVAFEEMLGGLKNLLGSSGVHFVVVGGVDLHDEWLRESATPNSLYRSVFAWQGYVGCSWQAAQRLLEDALLDQQARDKDVLARYLSFRGRGIIRNVLYEFNELVEWDGDGPFITVSGTAEDRVRLLAELSETLERMFGEASESMMEEPSDNDRLRQVSYFTVDWVLRAGMDAFTVGDVLDPGRETPLDPVLQPSEEIVHTVLRALVDAGFLRVTAPRTEVITEGPEADEYPEQYELSESMLARLESIADSSPRARAEFGRNTADLGWPEDAGSDARKALEDIVGARYRVLERIGRGGFGTVWRGVSNETGKPVAIKVIRTPSLEAQDRAAREGELLRRLNDPGIVPIIEVISAEDRLLLITELISGASLAEVTRLPARLAVPLGIRIAEIVDALHRKGIVHADIKPSNLIMSEGGQPVLIDLGTAQPLMDRSRRTRDKDTIVAGTRAYMAPELFLGDEVSDRSDVWSLGLLLLELISGKLPSARTPRTLRKAISGLEASDELKRCLFAALDPDPEARPTAAQMRSLLESTPEGTEPDRSGSS